jgi:hypothetical protein
LGSFTVGSGLPEDSDASDSGYCFLKDFKALAGEFWAEEGRSGDIAAGSRKASNESTTNGIGSGRKDDGDRRGRALGGQRRGRARGYNHINLESNQFGRKSGEPLELSPGISVFNHDIPTLDIAVVAQPLAEGSVERGVRWREREKSNSVHLPGRLRPGGERRGQEATWDQR